MNDKRHQILKRLLANPFEVIVVQAVIFDGQKVKLGKIVDWVESNPNEVFESLVSTK